MKRYISPKVAAELGLLIGLYLGLREYIDINSIIEGCKLFLQLIF